MAREQLAREEAVEFLTMQRDNLDELVTKEQVLELLKYTGDTIGYTPAFRCLVKGMEPEQAIRWGK